MTAAETEHTGPLAALLSSEETDRTKLFAMNQASGTTPFR